MLSFPTSTPLAAWSRAAGDTGYSWGSSVGLVVPRTNFSADPVLVIAG